MLNQQTENSVKGENKKNKDLTEVVRKKLLPVAEVHSYNQFPSNHNGRDLYIYIYIKKEKHL